MNKVEKATEKIDICIITKNSMKTLPLCLSAIRRFIPNSRIIVVDGYSEDGTIEYAKNMGCEVYLDNGTRGTARQKCIEKVTTDVFAFIDSDVVIHKTWLKEMMGWLEKLGPKVGAVTGIPDIYPLSTPRRYQKFLQEFSGVTSLTSPVKIQSLHTGSCLIRKKAVKGIKFPRWLQHREDTFLARYILGRGYECWRVPVKFKHYTGGTWASIFAESSANSRLLNILTSKQLLRGTIRSVPSSLKMALYFHEPRIIIWNMLRQLYTVDGFINWQKYLYVKR